MILMTTVSLAAGEYSTSVAVYRDDQMARALRDAAEEAAWESTQAVYVQRGREQVIQFVGDFAQV